MKKWCVAFIIGVGVVVLAGLGVLTWYLVTRDSDGGQVQDVETIQLEGAGFGDALQRSYVTHIRGAGSMFWWFYESWAGDASSRPIIVWLDGVTGVPPSAGANIAMFGPYDLNLNRRDDSWVNDYNLLFVDAPLGTGFSTVEQSSNISGDLDVNAQHLVHVLEAFYEQNEDFRGSPLYIAGQGHGTHFALALADKLLDKNVSANLQGVLIGNGIVDPSLALSKLGFYLEEMGYIYSPGRQVVDTLAASIQSDVAANNYESAFDKFLTLEEAVNDAGAVLINSGHLVEKLTTDDVLESSSINQKNYLQRELGVTDLYSIMDSVVAPALGLVRNSDYDAHRADLVQAFRESFMAPVVDKVENLLQNTNVTVVIYNGNLDVISNTPGQLEWVESLQWSGQSSFLSAPRRVLVFNSIIEGYFRESPRLRFYWINSAGLWAPLDNPVAMRRVLARTVGN